MHTKLVTGLIVAVMAFCSTSAFGQATKTYTKAKTDTKATDTKAKTTTQATAKKGAKPVASPGWVVIEEDWWFPHRNSFSESLKNAQTHQTNGDEKAAAAEIDKAVSWLKYAETHADKSYAGDLATAEADLGDFAMTLRQGGQVPALKVAEAFKNASAAMAKHHHFKGDKALAEGDIKTAAQHVLAAAADVKCAARSADREYGEEITEIDDYYCPLGFWDETVKLDKSRLEKNLSSVATELEKLGKEMK